MLKSASLKSRVELPRYPAYFWLFAIVIGMLAAPQAAHSQDFQLAAAPFNPFAVSPGGNSASNVTLTATSTVSVDLTCAVTSEIQTTPPTCLISPATVNAPGGAVATITSTGETTPGLYTVTITGTSSSNSHSAQQNLTVLAVSPQFTITVATAVAPSSVPAGNGGEGVININPINGYVSPTGPGGQTGVTLSCATVTPLVTVPPFCSFNPPNPTVTAAVTQSTITIDSFGPVTSHAAGYRRMFFAFWVPLPMLALAGLGAARGGKRSRRAWALLAMFIACGSLLLAPACSNSSTTSTTNPDGVTPNNSYTFTVLGVDADGNISSNTTGTNVGPTVSLTITTATN